MVSIIIPTFNRRTFLPRAVKSVLNQTFQSWELIIVDDGSTDQTQEVLHSLRDRRVHYVFQKHRGVSSARNTGIQLAGSPWICFLDSDDYWKPSKLERQIEELERNPVYQVVYTDEIWMRRSQRVNPRKIHRKYSGWIYHRCLPLCIISPSSVLLHRDVLRKEGLFDENLPVCEDYDLWLRVCSRRPILFLSEPLIVKVGGHPDQLSHSRWGMDRYRVEALGKIWSSGNLTAQQKLWTAQELIRKATILANGFAKRGKERQAEQYRSLADQYRISADL